MTVDQYALCPCGNGKKIKFCKCKDSLPELERVMTMLQGGQVVPGLDRINRILDEHPDAAWALAIKGRILLSLQEYASLSDNAERFVRLQPTNPLALTQRAASQVFRGQISEATESILEALSESNRQIDAFVLEIIAVLAFSLANSGKFLSARAYATLAITSGGREDGQAASRVLGALNTDSRVSHLLKSLPQQRPRPEHVEWAERFDEALGLLQSNRIALAESKFASLSRAYPGEPSILSGLLTCAIWSGNDQSQADCFEKLSRCEQLDPIERSKLLATSYLVDTKRSKLSVSMPSLSAEVEDALQAELAFQAHSLFLQLPEQLLREFRDEEDDVPPRSAFQILDHEVPADDVPLTVDNLPESRAIVLVYGKQTDRPSRIVVPSFPLPFADGVRETLRQVLPGLVFEEQSTDTVLFISASEPRAAVINRRLPRVEVEGLILAFQASRLGRRLVEQPLAALGKRSLLETVGDDSVRLQREALMRVLENAPAIAADEGMLQQIRQSVGLEKLPLIVVRSSDDIEEIANSDLGRLDCSELDSEGLDYLMQRARMIQATGALTIAANEALRREDTAENVDLKANAHLMLIQSESSPMRAADLISEAKRYFDKAGIDKAELLLMELPVMVRLGDSDRFQSVMKTLTTEYSDQEEVMLGVQQILVSLGLINPDGSPRVAPQPGGAYSAGPSRAAAEPSQSGGGIWTPESGSPASAGQGGSKLWVPGMD